MPRNPLPFWEARTLEELNPEEWEQLCDGCALCCLHKLQDEDTGEVSNTRVACRLLNLETRRCGSYRRRHKRVPTCVLLTPALVRKLPWLPDTCAYRRVAENRPLPEWHPLLSGDLDSGRKAMQAVAARWVSERDVDMERLEDYADPGPE